jgi:hypothetical protein
VTKNSIFDATNSALGYIYQVRYALLAALKKIPEALLQTKYHGTPGNITNRSPDIWKTLRVWIEPHNNQIINYSKSSLFLITTEKPKKNTLAYYLSEKIEKRNIEKAVEELTSIAETTPSKDNKAGYDAFNSLSAAQVILS